MNIFTLLQTPPPEAEHIAEKLSPDSLMTKGAEIAEILRNTPPKELVVELIEQNEATPSYSQAVRMHRESGQGFESISRERIDEIMAEEKPNQREQIRLRRDEFSKYFPADYGDKQIKADILAGLDLLHRQRIRERNRDAR